MREFSEKEIEEKYKDLKMMNVPDMWEDIERNLAPKNVEFKNVESKNAESQMTEKKADNKKAVGSRGKRIPIGRIASIAAVLAVVLLAVPVWNMIRQGVDGTMKSSDCTASESMESESIADESAEESIEDKSESEEIPERAADENAATNTEGTLEEESIKNDIDGKESSGVQEALQSRQLTIVVQILEVKETEDELVIRTELLEDMDTYKMGDVLDISCDAGENTEFTGEMKLLVEETEENLKLLQILP